MPSAGKQNERILQTALIIIIGIMAAAALVAGLMLRSNLTRQNDINVELLNRLTELKKENTRLEIEILSAYEPDNAYACAANEQHSGSTSIDIAVCDRAVILSTDESSALEIKISDWISSLRNIFYRGK